MSDEKTKRYYVQLPVSIGKKLEKDAKEHKLKPSLLLRLKITKEYDSEKKL